MKAIIEFDLNDPDDQKRYELANKSLDMGLIIWEILHNKKKSLYQTMNDGGDPVAQFYEWFWDELTSNGISIDKMII